MTADVLLLNVLEGTSVVTACHRLPHHYTLITRALEMRVCVHVCVRAPTCMSPLSVVEDRAGADEQQQQQSQHWGHHHQRNTTVVFL